MHDEVLAVKSLLCSGRNLGNDGTKLTVYFSLTEEAIGVLAVSVSVTGYKDGWLPSQLRTAGSPSHCHNIIGRQEQLHYSCK